MVEDGENGILPGMASDQKLVAAGRRVVTAKAEVERAKTGYKSSKAEFALALQRYGEKGQRGVIVDGFRVALDPGAEKVTVKKVTVQEEDAAKDAQPHSQKWRASTIIEL